MNDSALVKLDAARHALAECKTVMEAKEIADVAEAARVYLERTNASVETVNRAAEIRTLAERQMGEFLKQMPKATGTAGMGRPKIGGAEAEPPKSPALTLASIGITKKQSSTAQKLASLPIEEVKERIAVVRMDGKQPTPARVLAQPPQPARRHTVSVEAIAAGEEAERDSEKLWHLKNAWRKASKKDRDAFLLWIQKNK